MGRIQRAFKWQTIDAVIDGLSTELNLPAEWRSNRASNSWSVTISAWAFSLVSNSPSVRITNDTAKQLWQSRREAKEESDP